MSALDTRIAPAVPERTSTGAGRALTRLAVRQIRRGALVVAGLAAGMSALVVATYESTVGDALDAAALAALAENPAIRTLFGPPIALDDPGGFTVWRTGTVLAVLTAVWALMTAIRVTRGEEEAGRWDLLLAGRLSTSMVVVRHLLVLVVTLLAVGLATSAALLATGTAPDGAVLHGTGIALIGVFFTALGGLLAQLSATRALAIGVTAAVLGGSLLVRMVGDGVASLGWLRWLSPFGLIALVRPYSADRVVPLVVLALSAIALLVAVPVVARRRDVRAGWLPDRSRRASRLWLLGSIDAFAVRRLLRPFLGWAAGVSAYYLLIGLLAVSMVDFLRGNPRFAQLAADAGFAGIGSVDGYAAAMFGLLAVPVGVFVASRIAATAADESARRLTPLHAQPVTRLRWLTVETVAAMVAALALTTVAGLATWSGAVGVDAPLGLGAALAGAWNVMPIVLLCLGAAVCALGWLPRAVLLVGSLPAAGGFLWQVLAESTNAPGWLAGLSPFTHLASVPETSVDWRATTGMLVVAVGLTCLGAVGYHRRDLSG
ncbi:ABC transporter membrane-spanning protein [Micromonospora polyrhachis]|uniref:ABC-2 type transport system permease protein n=1 Tax=Micromonospora polyrhachis TaxID=1282883 RepID=A0A7W7SW31_9ACTN|nr:hypothetical protein [Micromonospora polyrhachis]MBB4962004.1 ABC-2 type transport system permease protein [Micromonospora polyrhachis]